MGIPACAIFHQTTVLDLVFPRILAGVKVKKEDVEELGYGGLCRKCEQCDFPTCSFGKV